MKILVLIVILLSCAAYAIPHSDCTRLFANRFKAEHVEKLSFAKASEIAISEGLLQGRDLRSAMIRLDRAKQIYAIYTSSRGGSATDLVAADRNCTINDIVRVQED